MEETRFSGSVLTIYDTIRRDSLEYSLHFHRCDNLIYYTILLKYKLNEVLNEIAFRPMGGATLKLVTGFREWI